jgi:protein-disulfide isomerase
MSRSRTVERRKERERERQRRQQITAVVAVVAVVVVAALALILANQPAEAPISEEALTRYEDIARGTTEEGFPILGDAAAPVKVIEYSSFDCTHCRDFHESVTPAILERVRAGEVQFTYVPLFGTGGIANGEGAARAAVCAGQQDKFWALHDTLFNWQGVYGNQAFANNRILAGIDALGMDRGAWDQCMSGELPINVLRAAITAAQNLPGFEGTPTVTINGIIVTGDVTSVTNAIDQELANAGPVQPQAEATSEATAEATAEATTEATMDATAESAAPEVEATEAPVEATAEATP